MNGPAPAFVLKQPNKNPGGLHFLIVGPTDLNATGGRTIDADQPNHLESIPPVFFDLIDEIANSIATAGLTLIFDHSSGDPRILRFNGRGRISIGLAVESEIEQFGTGQLDQADAALDQGGRYFTDRTWIMRTAIDLSILIQDTVSNEQNAFAAFVFEHLQIPGSVK